MKKEHILIIRFSALGDVAMAVPVVYSLAKTYPQVLSLIHISEPTRQAENSYAVFCLKKKKQSRKDRP